MQASCLTSVTKVVTIGNPSCLARTEAKCAVGMMPARPLPSCRCRRECARTIVPSVPFFEKRCLFFMCMQYSRRQGRFPRGISTLIWVALQLKSGLSRRVIALRSKINACIACPDISGSSLSGEGEWDLDESRRALLRIMSLISICTIAIGAMPFDASALPRNPERPFAEKTCAQAQARYEEALRGNSLVSREQNRKLVEQARRSMIRLCGKDK